MYKKLLHIVVIMFTLLLNSMAMAQIDVTGPLDIVVGVPDDGDWPPTELPRFAIDDQILTKYLHFKGDTEPTGIRVTPAMGPTVVTGVRFCSANDTAGSYPGRAPVTYELSGSNESIDGPYTLIHSGRIVDFAGPTEWPNRTWTTTPMMFENDVAYKHYQLLFPTTWNHLYGTTADCMQIAEVELLMKLYKASGPSPANGEVYAQTWATLGWTPGYGATSHDVYVSDNLADVENRVPEAFAGNFDELINYTIIGIVGCPFPDGLVPGTTYYWRVDEIDADGTTKHEGDIWSFTVPPHTAWKPSPLNNGQFIDPNADLSWSPGWGAKLHYVYFGDNFDDVNNAAGATMQITASYALDTLELGKTYYWRVDESDGRQTYKGNVWSFTTTTGEGGIKGEYFTNSTLSGTPALVRIDKEVNFNLVGSESPGAPIPGDGWSARWTADLNVLFADTYTFHINSQDGTRLWIDGELILDMWVAWVTTKYASLPVYLEQGIHSLRLEFFDSGETDDTDAVQELSWSTPTMTEVIIPAGPLQPPTKANTPNPPNNAKDVKQTTLMSWNAGDMAALSQLYFGTDKEAVKNADAASPEYKGSMELGAEIYDSGLLEFGTTYYWRVDSVNDLNTDSPWAGVIWNFTTADYLLIDDFEDYDIGNKEIWWFWKDGLGYTNHPTEPAYTGNGTGAEVGVLTTTSYMEESIVYRGTKSMPVYYNNPILRISEVELALGGIDLTQNGGTTLKLYFQGIDTNSADPLYVAINGIAVENADPAAAQVTKWTEWNIPLQAFVDKGADVTNAISIKIGIGSTQQAGGTGTMYFDDIGVHP